MGRLTGSIMAAFGVVAFAGVAQADDAPLPNDPNVCTVVIDDQTVLIPNIHIRVQAMQEWLNQERSAGLVVDGLCGENTEAALQAAFAEGHLTYNPDANVIGTVFPPELERY